jgi:hypothetical protein
VKIEQIEIEGAPCLFKRVRLPGKKGKVQATVGDAAEKCESTYAIWFSIYNPDQESVVFRLDPKLRGNTIATSFSAYLQNFINNFPIDIKLKEELIKVIENFEK